MKFSNKAWEQYLAEIERKSIKKAHQREMKHVEIKYTGFIYLSHLKAARDGRQAQNRAHFVECDAVRKARLAGYACEDDAKEHGASTAAASKAGNDVFLKAKNTADELACKKLIENERKRDIKLVDTSSEASAIYYYECEAADATRDEALEKLN